MNCLPPGPPSSWGAWELHEMKRDNRKPAIVSACERHGIKVSGKNKDELSGKLFEHLKEKCRNLSGCSRKLVIDDTSEDEDHRQKNEQDQYLEAMNDQEMPTPKEPAVVQVDPEPAAVQVVDPEPTLTMNKIDATFIKTLDKLMVLFFGEGLC
jgi:hypothetical protein